LISTAKSGGDAVADIVFVHGLDGKSHDTSRHGIGFSRSNVMIMRAFYLAFPKVRTLSGLLIWSHFVKLLSIDDSLERSFYEKYSSPSSIHGINTTVTNRKFPRTHHQKR
jgi:hypothetical protein